MSLPGEKVVKGLFGIFVEREKHAVGRADNSLPRAKPSAVGAVSL
jgi:hypothetical protein